MRKLVLSTALALGLAHTALAQDDPISSVIQNQLDAFQADDFATAFTYASPMIKGMFGTSENFGIMVQRGYPMVHRPAGVIYLDQREAGPVTYQTIEITDQRGQAHFLEYEMIETAEGWQINGVRFVPAPSLGA